MRIEEAITEARGKVVNTDTTDLIAMLQAKRGMTTADVTMGSRGRGDSPLTYKVPKGMILAKGGRVVVPAGERFSIATVAEVHEFAEIELESGIEYKWIVDKISFETYDALLEEEQSMIRQLRQAQAMERLQRIATASGVDLDKIETKLIG